ncbi:acetyl-CoA carboxylase biotin carboxyl carrier protein [Nonomuraea purpurea]|uniref:Biotin carboxyl carrier protein of acetyl-CoA carboxylase n=1 Tax=Nonomuraea purpurea TaxID=1849276 RepID=A0ABV8FZL5_9ACTN
MADHGDLIETVYRQTVDFVEAIGGPVRRLKVTVGEVSLEVEWPGAEPPAIPVAAPGNGLVNGIAGFELGALALNGMGADGSAAMAAATVASQGAQAAVAVQGPPAVTESLIHSPMVGTFYRCPEPGAEPFVKEGDLVAPGQQVAILEAMKMMNPIQALTAGRITRILVEEADSVEYGQALFALEES